MKKIDEIGEILERHAKEVIGKIGIGFKNFKTGEEYYVNGDDRFPTASTFKVPVLIELFNQASQGKFSLNDMYVLKYEDLSPGSGILSFLTPGLSMCIMDYAFLMMSLSDNTATDYIHQMLGKDNIKAMIERMGLKNTMADMTCRELIYIPVKLPMNTDVKEARKIFAKRDYEKDYTLITDMSVPNDISSPKDMMTMFSLIYNEEIVSPEACREMMDIMEKCSGTRRIPHYLPSRGPRAVKAIHKTGTLEYICCDCGIIVTPEQTYGLTMLYNGYTGDPQDKRAAHDSDEILALISRDIYNALHTEPAAAE